MPCNKGIMPLIQIYIIWISLESSMKHVLARIDNYIQVPCESRMETSIRHGYNIYNVYIFIYMDMIYIYSYWEFIMETHSNTPAYTR